MSFKESMQNLAQYNTSYDHTERAEEIRNDIKSVLSDDTALGDWIGERVGAAFSAAVEKLGIDNIANNIGQGMEQMVSDALYADMQSDTFAQKLGDGMASREIARNTPSYDDVSQKSEPEMTE